MMDAVVVFVCVRLMTYDFAIKRMKNQHKTTMILDSCAENGHKQVIFVSESLPQCF